MGAKCLPQLKPGSQTHHDTARTNRTIYIIQWRNVTCGGAWYTYARVFSSAQSARASLAGLRTWRKRRGEKDHEYRVAIYTVSGVVKE